MMREGVLSVVVAGCLALGVTTACGGTAEQDQTPAAQEPLTGGSRPDGTYVLASVGTAPLPALLVEEGDCRLEVVDGSMRMEAGRFAFQNSTREVCAGATRVDTIMHAAGGSYALEGAAVVLRTDVGDAFAQARGTLDEAGLTLQQLSTDAGAETVLWRLERSDALVQRTDSARE